MQGSGVEGDVVAISASHQVGDKAVGVQLGVAVAAGAVGEGGHREPVGRHPAADATALLAGEGSSFLQEPDGLVGRFDHGDRHDSRGFGGPEGPQERHALRDREGHVDGPDLPLPESRQQVLTRVGVEPVDQGPQLRRSDDAFEAEGLCPLAPPHTRRLPRAHVVVLHSVGHRRDEILGALQLGDRQHDAHPRSRSPVTGHASPKGWQVPADVGVVVGRDVSRGIDGQLAKGRVG